MVQRGEPAPAFGQAVLFTDNPMLIAREAANVYNHSASDDGGLAFIGTSTLPPFASLVFVRAAADSRVLPLSDNRKVVATGVGATLWGDRPQTQATGRR